MRNSNIPIRSPPLGLSQQMYQPSYPMSISQQLTPNSQMGYPGMHNYQGTEQKYIEQIPYEKKTVDYYPQEKVEYIPQEKKYEDFLEVQHELDYVPVPRLEKYTDHVPLERFDTYYDYMPRQNTIVRSTGSNYVPPPPNQYQGQGASQYLGPSPSRQLGYNQYQGSYYPNQLPGYNYQNYQGSFGYGPQRYGSYYDDIRMPPTLQGSQYGQRYPMPSTMGQRPISANRVPPYYPQQSPYSGYSRYRYI